MIGTEVIYENKKMIVQDIDYIQLIVKIGIPDENNIVWIPMWVCIDKINKVKK